MMSLYFIFSSLIVMCLGMAYVPINRVWTSLSFLDMQIFSFSQFYALRLHLHIVCVLHWMMSRFILYFLSGTSVFHRDVWNPSTTFWSLVLQRIISPLPPSPLIDSSPFSFSFPFSTQMIIVDSYLSSRTLSSAVCLWLWRPLSKCLLWGLSRSIPFL